MTARAILLGLLGAAVVCGITYINDAVIGNQNFIGNHLPLAVYGGLIAFILLVNPVLGRARSGLALSGRELAVVLALTLAACCIPGTSLMRLFPSAVILPHHFQVAEPGWTAQEAVQTAPDPMLVDVSGEDDNRVLSGFLHGLEPAEGRDHISFSDVPWSAWAPS